MVTEACYDRISTLKWISCIPGSRECNHADTGTALLRPLSFHVSRRSIQTKRALTVWAYLMHSDAPPSYIGMGLVPWVLRPWSCEPGTNKTQAPLYQNRHSPSLWGKLITPLVTRCEEPWAPVPPLCDVCQRAQPMAGPLISVSCAAGEYCAPRCRLLRALPT